MPLMRPEQPGQRGRTDRLTADRANRPREAPPHRGGFFAPGFTRAQPPRAAPETPQNALRRPEGLEMTGLGPEPSGREM